MTPRFNLPANSARLGSASRIIRIDPAAGSASAPAMPEEIAPPIPEVEAPAVEAVPVVETLRVPGEYAPETYEPNYSYPLIVWLTTGEDDFDLTTTMEAVSDRNYLGLQVNLSRIFQAASETEGYIQQLHVHELSLLKVVRGAIAKFRRNYKVHSERIYLAGTGLGAIAALHLGLSRPEWFGGVISIDAGVERIPQLLRRFRHLQGERVLLAHSRGAAETSRNAEMKLAKMLYAAGLRVSRRAYATTKIHPRQSRTPHLHRDIDRWVMQDIAQAQMV